VHLHLLSVWSFPDGATRTDTAAHRAAECEQPALAITDVGTLHGVVAFYEAAQSRGLKPIIGCRMPLSDPQYPFLRGALVLLAEDFRGYRNLLRLSSLAHLAPPLSGPPAISLETLAAHRTGLIALSGGEAGPLTQALRAGNLSAARRLAATLTELFGKESFFIELQRQGLPGQIELTGALRALGRETGVATVATHEVRYALPEEKELQTVVAAVRSGTMAIPITVDPAQTPGDYHLATTDEMYARFADDEPSLRRTAEIAARCVVELPRRPEIRFAHPALPPGYRSSGETDEEAEFRWLTALVREALSRHLSTNGPEWRRQAEHRLERELHAIGRAGYARYLLVLADLAQFVRAHGIAYSPGRGTLCASLTAFLLGITEIDPLRHAIPFECFLNAERPTPPLLELEISASQRDRLLAYLRDRYGEDHVAAPATYHLFSLRTAVRDVARGMAMPTAEAERLLALIPDDLPHLPTARGRNPMAWESAIAQHPRWAKCLSLAQRLTGLPRQLESHPSALVISDLPLVESAPVQRDRSGHLRLQYDLRSLSVTGLLRINLHNSRLLDAIQLACERIAPREGRPCRPEAIALEDPLALNLLNRGDTVGIPHLEQDSARDTLRRLGVSTFEDVVAAIALNRPSSAAAMEELIGRKQGRLRRSAPHKAWKTLTARTYGLLLYGEQIAPAAEALAGFTPTEGDLLRQALLSRDAADIRRWAAVFLERCRRKRRMPSDVAEALFEHLRRCAESGASLLFGVPNAILAMRCAWLKAHYPVEFFSGLLAEEHPNASRRAAWIAEAERLGLEWLGPCLNASTEHYRLEGGRIRCGLADIKFVGCESAEVIVTERKRHGPYRGLFDLCRRIAPEHLPKRTLEALVRAGALDFTGVPRSRLFAGIEAAMVSAARRRAETGSAQSLLPGLEATEAVEDAQQLPEVAPWSESRQMADEEELLGFHISGRAMHVHAWMFPLLNLRFSVAAWQAGDAVRMAGLLAEGGSEGRLYLETPKEEIELELSEAIALPGVWRAGTPVWVEGILQPKGEHARLIVHRIGDLEKAPETLARSVILRIPPSCESSDLMGRLEGVLQKHAGPIPLEMRIARPDGSRGPTEAGIGYRVRLCAAFVREVEAMLGRGALTVEITSIAT